MTGNFDGSVSFFVGGLLKHTKQFSGHSPLVKFINGQIVVALACGKLVILDEYLDIKKDFKPGNTGKIYALQIPYELAGNEHFLVSGDNAGVLRLYKRNGDRNPFMTIKYNGQIATISVQGYLTAVASMSMVHVFDMQQQLELFELEHDWIVSCVKIYGKRLITASQDGKVRIWNLINGKEVDQLTSNSKCQNFDLR